MATMRPESKQKALTTIEARPLAYRVEHFVLPSCLLSLSALDLFSVHLATMRTRYDIAIVRLPPFINRVIVSYLN